MSGNELTQSGSFKKYLTQIYKRLFLRYGPQKWWPADTRFEVVLGAILTQNTNWRNVEKAISHLRQESSLTPIAIRNITPEELGRLIKPAGYFNVKAKRIKNFVDFLFDRYDGQLERMRCESVEKLRQEFLSINGIGPETADSILLYALDKPIFVVDAYTQRMLSRHRLISDKTDYQQVQELFMKNFKADTIMFNEYHALIVRLGKEFCKSQAFCDTCPLNDISYSKEWVEQYDKRKPKSR